MNMSETQKHRLGIADLIGDKRTEILRLAAKHGAYNVRIFGSVARGEAREDSDVDFLVSFPSRTSIFDVVGLWQDLTELLQREVDVVTDNQAQRSQFKRHILKEAVAL